MRLKTTRKQSDTLGVFLAQLCELYNMALQQYRNAKGINSKLIVVGLVANEFSIADPTDAGMMDVVGFDSAVPNIISNFVNPDAGNDTIEGDDL